MKLPAFSSLIAPEMVCRSRAFARPLLTNAGVILGLFRSVPAAVGIHAIDLQVGTARAAWGRVARSEAYQVSRSCTTRPCTSVRRKSRPA